MAAVTIFCDGCDEVIETGILSDFNFKKAIDAHDEVCEAYDDEDDEDEDED